MHAVVAVGGCPRTQSTWGLCETDAAFKPSVEVLMTWTHAKSCMLQERPLHFMARSSEDETELLRKHQMFNSPNVQFAKCSICQMFYAPLFNVAAGDAVKMARLHVLSCHFTLLACHSISLHGSGSVSSLQCACLLAAPPSLMSFDASATS